MDNCACLTNRDYKGHHDCMNQDINVFACVLYKGYVQAPHEVNISIPSQHKLNMDNQPETLGHTS